MRRVREGMSSGLQWVGKDGWVRSAAALMTHSSVSGLPSVEDAIDPAWPEVAGSPAGRGHR
jgi:hypothetical protein